VGSQRRITISAWPLIFVALTGCAIVDQYASRAVSYNFEAEQALDQGLLLNIVRASLRRPMQFTSVQSISGTASIGASAVFTVPFVPGTGGSSFTPTISGGPTFSVPVLDTQEFYQGVMRPIQNGTFDFYIHQEFPREELFTLFVEKIVMHRDNCAAFVHTANCELKFINYPGSDLQFDLTQSLIEHLLNLGISTEQIPAPSGGGSSASGSSGSGSGTSDQGLGSGPPYRFCFAPRDPRYAQQIKDQSALCGFEKKQAKKPDKQKVTTTTAYKDTKSTDKNGVQTSSHEEDRTIERAPDGSDKGPPEKAIGKKVAGFVLSDQFIENLKTIAAWNKEKQSADSEEFARHIDAFRATNVSLRDNRGNIVDDKGNKVSLTIYTRSTEGILYFLGEIVRRELYTDTVLHPEQQNRITKIKIETTAYPSYPELPCDPQQPLPHETYDHVDGLFTCTNLFRLDANPGLLSTSLTSVTYNGLTYWIPADEAAAGKTLHVLSIVKQLLALNTSAKSLPQTNTISILSP
jgi:hypothetical protein